jgi:protein transport protein SEC9
MENEIEENLDRLALGVRSMKTVATAIGKEADEQNKHLDRIGGKVDRVDDEIALNRSRLDRFK